MRRTSIIFGIASLVVPFAWAYFATTALYREASAGGRYVCGLPALANFLLASLVCALTSAAALIVGFVAYHRLPRPRPRLRSVELAALALPSLIVGSFALITFAYFGILFVLHGGNPDFLDIDSCLDSGGRWNYAKRTCEH
jgi:hypothetical protein